MEANNNAWYLRPLYRHGMLLVILLLLSNGIRRVVTDSNDTGSALLVPAMLLVNHLVFSFLPPERQRRMRVPQFLFLGFGLLYVVVTFAIESRR